MKELEAGHGCDSAILTLLIPVNIIQFWHGTPYKVNEETSFDEAHMPRDKHSDERFIIKPLFFSGCH